jgi:hypothetical protein
VGFRWRFLKVFFPTAISLIALFVPLWDRRRRLVLRPRKGAWAKVSVTQTGKDFTFKGLIEVYNLSSRSNAIRDYEFWCKREYSWEKMESELYRELAKGELYNETPLALAPYSGSEVKVMAMGKIPVADMSVRVEIEDLSGKRYRIELPAFNRFEDQA